ncbi:hypothetical protein F511_07507 [Dorcoceras hygrometricum]|uniref:Uncharacterized protein n=1 Tax=Dorcoceras hygrometricum TaxID=472368 RepID=A0A2Z7D2E0_9LAMI|nr:hypothetical protein F511_07507 [Dorcoceras hygrometricum]
MINKCSKVKAQGQEFVYGSSDIKSYVSPSSFRKVPQEGFDEYRHCKHPIIEPCFSKVKAQGQEFVYGSSDIKSYVSPSSFRKVPQEGFDEYRHCKHPIIEPCFRQMYDSIVIIDSFQFKHMISFEAVRSLRLKALSVKTVLSLGYLIADCVFEAVIAEYIEN